MSAACGGQRGDFESFRKFTGQPLSPASAGQLSSSEESLVRLLLLYSALRFNKPAAIAAYQCAHTAMCAYNKPAAIAAYQCAHTAMCAYNRPAAIAAATLG